MSNTLKFGAGEWATKKGSTLAYNSQNGNFKPLPFTFDRSTSATRVNKDGLIEVVSNNEPRIDFKDDASGALLLEPSRSNLITYSEDFNNASWTTYQATISSNSITSPDGNVTADKLIDSTSNDIHANYKGFTISTESTLSYFVKSAEYSLVSIANLSDGGEAVFNLSTGTVVSTSSTWKNSTIIALTNGWFKISATTNGVSGAKAIGIKLVNNSGALSFAGTGTSGVYLWGAQLEQGSYATSYIPTQGSIGTRVAESCEQTTPSGIIGQTEGSVYVEGTAILDVNGSMPFTIYLNSSNILYCWFRTNGIIDIDVFAGTFQDRIRTSVDTIANGDYFKLSVGYKSNDLVAYLNGVQIGTASPTLIPSCSSLIVGGYIAADYTGSLIKETKLYNTRLSNTELQALTKI